MSFSTTFFFILRVLNTYIKLKLKFRNINHYEIWCLDFYLFAVRNKLNIIKETEEYFIIEYNLNEQRKFIIRHKPSSDFSVFTSVIIEKQYDFLYKFDKDEDLKIIDAGANVGYTAIYFKDRFPNSQIICLEPCNLNFSILSNNIKLNSLTGVNLLEKALWHEKSTLYLDNNFRDRREHSIRTIENENNSKNSVESISLKQIMEDNFLNKMNILKVDIEGAEDKIFRYDVNLSHWLSKTDYFVIEIHDEYDCRNIIEEKLKQHQFEIQDKGELTIAYKAF